MGQAMVDGYLPYTRLWDLKPPLVFYFFAGIIAVFGKSFIAIRLIGSLVVALIAWFTFKTSNQLFDKIPSFFAGLLTIYLLSLFGAMQGVMSEHLAALPLVAGVYYLFKYQHTTTILLSGFLFGLAIMFRLNLAYALFIVYAYLVLQEGFNWQGIQKGIWLALGSLSAFFLTFLPYLVTQNLDLITNSVFKASLAYSDVGMDKMFKTLPLVIGFVVLCALSWKFLKPKNSYKSLMLIVVMIIGQSVMFFKSGKINGHYLIQVFPFLAILVVALVSQIKLINTIKRIIPTALFILFAALPVESYLELKTIFSSKNETGTFYNGEGNTVANYIKQHFDKEKYQKILFLNEHIGYWNLHTYPPTAMATHPSNLVRESAYPFVQNARQNPMEEFDFILNKIQPNFIVFDERRIPMDKRKPEFSLLQKTLENDYVLEKEFGNKNQVKLYRKDFKGKKYTF